jgi:DNA-binding NarL/FixJ family response regulator
MKNPILTDSNKQIIELLASGKTVKEAASILKMNNRTVEDRILEMRRQLNCINTTQLVVKIFEMLKDEVNDKT